MPSARVTQFRDASCHRSRSAFSDIELFSPHGIRIHPTDSIQLLDPFDFLFHFLPFSLSLSFSVCVYKQISVGVAPGTRTGISKIAPGPVSARIPRL